MGYVKIDRDTILDKIYECRGKIDFTNKEALELISQIVDIVVHAQEDNKSKYPTIRIS